MADDPKLTINTRTLQTIAALAMLAAAIVIASSERWIFSDRLAVSKTDPTLSQLIFSDRATVGFIRFAIILLALYVIVSVPALVVGGRWVKGFTTTGVTADDPVAAVKDSADAIKDLQTKVEELQKQRDAATALAQKALEA